MITENLSTLKIHKLTKAQYERELEAGRIDENALYLTPDEDNSDFELNYKIYSSISQIGLSGAVTTADVLAAMPYQSILRFSNNTDSGTDYLSDAPVTYSLVELRRDVSFGCGSIVRLSATAPEFYEANWHVNSGFSGWIKKVAYTSETKNSMLANLGALNINNVASNDEFVIKSGDDLDTYTTPGTYISSSNSITSSLLNAPSIAAGFRLIVSAGNAASTAMQIVISNDAKGTLFFRNKKTNSGWYAWEKILRNVLTSSEYGSSLPSTGTAGQVYFLKG